MTRFGKISPFWSFLTVHLVFGKIVWTYFDQLFMLLGKKIIFAEKGQKLKELSSRLVTLDATDVITWWHAKKLIKLWSFSGLKKVESLVVFWSRSVLLLLLLLLLLLQSHLCLSVPKLYKYDSSTKIRVASQIVASAVHLAKVVVYLCVYFTNRSNPFASVRCQSNTYSPHHPKLISLAYSICYRLVIATQPYLRPTQM